MSHVIRLKKLNTILLEHLPINQNMSLHLLFFTNNLKIHIIEIYINLCIKH